MDKQRIQEIAESAFKQQFGDVKIVRINVRPRIDHDGDHVVHVKIIYDGKYEQLNIAGLSDVQYDIVSKAWREVDEAEDDLGFPIVHFVAKSDIGRRDPATV